MNGKKIEGYNLTQIITRVRCQQQELYKKAPKSLITNISNGGITTYEPGGEIWLPKEWVQAIDAWKTYIDKKYRSVDLELPQIEDIFRYLCNEHIWKQLEKNKEENENWNKIINEIINEIEDETHNTGLFQKIKNEKKIFNYFIL
jgi:hypothetical protein